jgi:putative membrane protein insertion efficiency factor
VIVLNAQAAAIQAIHVYQRTLAPATDRIGLRCRFTPSCSRYAENVIARDGVMRGGWLALKRIARCNPLTPAGTRDDP